MDDQQHFSSLVSDTDYAQTPSLCELNAQLVAEINSWRRLDVCPVCDARSVTRFATIRHFPYSRCRACGLTFANPVPSNEVLDAFYNSPFYGNYRRLEAKRIARDRYFSISMYTDMRRLASWLGGDQSLTILDYGCGPGAFLALLRDEFGFSNVEGLELSRVGVEFARQHYGLTVASSTAELRRQFYDCVILIEVIEHLPDPAAIFSQLSKLVRPGGHVLITTPSVDNLLGRFFPSLCMHYTAPSHISLFTRQALASLLSRFSFEIERIETDECFLTLERVGMSLAYDLDFVSPQHDEDDNDALYIPNGLGRLLGFQPGRSPVKGPFGRLCKKLIGFFSAMCGGECPTYRRPITCTCWPVRVSDCEEARITVPSVALAGWWGVSQSPLVAAPSRAGRERADHLTNFERTNKGNPDDQG